MASLSRLWFALPPDDGGALAATVERLAQQPLAALTHGPDERSARLAERLSSAGAPAAARLVDASLDAVDGLVAAHPDAELALVAGPELLLAAVARALGLRTPPALPRPGSLSAFHWPTGRDPEARVELIGLDLDWLPPWHAGQPRSRYPGGPGVAGRARG